MSCQDSFLIKYPWDIRIFIPIPCFRYSQECYKFSKQNIIIYLFGQSLCSCFQLIYETSPIINNLSGCFTLENHIIINRWDTYSELILWGLFSSICQQHFRQGPAQNLVIKLSNYYCWLFKIAHQFISWSLHASCYLNGHIHICNLKFKKYRKAE